MKTYKWLLIDLKSGLKQTLDLPEDWLDTDKAYDECRSKGFDLSFTLAMIRLQDPAGYFFTDIKTSI